MNKSSQRGRSDKLTAAALVVIRLICIFFAIYMSINQVYKYIANEDKAIVTYRKFHDSTRDEYPTYTICFEIKKGNKKNNEKLSGNFFNQTYLELSLIHI